MEVLKTFLDVLHRTKVAGAFCMSKCYSTLLLIFIVAVIIIHVKPQALISMGFC